MFSHTTRKRVKPMEASLNSILTIKTLKPDEKKKLPDKFSVFHVCSSRILGLQSSTENTTYTALSSDGGLHLYNKYKTKG